MNFHNQLTQQMTGHKAQEIVPCTLRNGDMTMPVYTKVGNLVKGRAVYHLETLQKIDVGTGKKELAKTYWRVTAKGQLVEQGYDLISSDEWNTWLTNHNSNITL